MEEERGRNGRAGKGKERKRGVGAVVSRASDLRRMQRLRWQKA